MIQVKQGDRRPPATATIKRGIAIVPLDTAASVTFKMTPVGGATKTVDAAATITDAPLGEVEYRWAVGDTDTPGEYEAEWEVVWSDGTNETFPTIDYDIVLIYGDLDGR
jgi:hypothetical protein